MFLIGMGDPIGYRILMLVGAVCALALGLYRCMRKRILLRKAALATVLLPLFAMFFSHLLYCLVTWEVTAYSQPAGFFFSFWEEGTMIYGGLLGVVLALGLVGRKDFAAMLDQYAPGMALMVAVARVGEGMLGQGYGEYAMEEGFFCRYPFMMFDPTYEEWAWALFVLEALVALALFVFLLIHRPRRQGDGALLFFGLYACAQVVLESLRRDEFLRWGFVRVDEVFSGVVVLIVLVCYAWQAGRGKALAKALCYVCYVLMVAACLLLEFATEGRIPFLLFLEVNACYIAMAAACVGMGACIFWMRSLREKERNDLYESNL